MFERMRERGAAPDTKGTIETLLREHVALAEKGNVFRDMLIGVVDGALVEREALVAAGRDYAEFLGYHARLEDETVFMEAAQLLDDADWSVIERAFEAQPTQSSARCPARIPSPVRAHPEQRGGSDRSRSTDVGRRSNGRGDHRSRSRREHLASEHDVLLARVFLERMAHAVDARHEEHRARQAARDDLGVVHCGAGHRGPTAGAWRSAACSR